MSMREKKLWLVISFETTTAAMAVEALCKQDGIEYCFVPTMQALGQDCGIQVKAACAGILR